MLYLVCHLLLPFQHASPELLHGKRLPVVPKYPFFLSSTVKEPQIFVWHMTSWGKKDWLPDLIAELGEDMKWNSDQWRVCRNGVRNFWAVPLEGGGRAPSFSFSSLLLIEMGIEWLPPHWTTWKRITPYGWEMWKTGRNRGPWQLCATADLADIMPNEHISTPTNVKMTRACGNSLQGKQSWHWYTSSFAIRKFY